MAIDGGCHKGMHTGPLARCCKRVIAVDANPDMCAYLAEQNRKTGVNNCEIVQAALQDDENADSVTFYISDNFLGRSSLTRLWDSIDKEVVYRPVTAPATTIDKLVRERGIDRVDFIKLDLEGGEYRALRGAANVLRRDALIFVMENSVHAAKQGGFLETDPFDYLSGLGYALLAPNGSRVARDRPFPFWYLFGIPLARLDELKARLQDAYAGICRSRNLI